MTQLLEPYSVPFRDIQVGDLIPVNNGALWEATVEPVETEPAEGEDIPRWQVESASGVISTTFPDGPALVFRRHP